MLKIVHFKRLEWQWFARHLLLSLWLCGLRLNCLRLGGLRLSSVNLRGIGSAYGFRSQHLHIVSPYLRHKTALTLFVVIGRVSDATFDIEFVAFMHILLYDLSQFSPKNYIVPVSMIRHLSTILESVTTFSSGQTKACNSNSLFNVTYFRILSYVSNQHNFIHNNSFKRFIIFYLAIPK